MPVEVERTPAIGGKKEMGNRDCAIPPEVRDLQKRQKNIDRRLRFVEAKLGIVRPEVVQELEVAEEPRPGTSSK